MVTVPLMVLTWVVINAQPLDFIECVTYVSGIVCNLCVGSLNVMKLGR